MLRISKIPASPCRGVFATKMTRAGARDIRQAKDASTLPVRMNLNVPWTDVDAAYIRVADR